MKGLALVAFALIGITIFVRILMEFQLEREVSFYKKFFRLKKDGLHGVYNPIDIKQIPKQTIDDLYRAKMETVSASKPIDWSKYAYVNYVTEPNYLCNTLIMFHALIKKFGTKAKLELLISNELFKSEIQSRNEQVQRILKKIRELDSEQIVIKEVQNIVKPTDQSPWNESLTKLLVFGLTEYERIIYLDNDAILQDKMDELFFLPNDITFAAPLTYWFMSEKDLEKTYKEVQHDKMSINLNKYTKQLSNRIRNGKEIYNHLPALPQSLYLNSDRVAKEILDSTSSASPLFDADSLKKVGKVKFASNLMVIKPSQETYDYIINDCLPRIVNKKEKYDMDLINEELYNLRHVVSRQVTLFRKLRSAFKPSILVLPFGTYGILTGSIRKPQEHMIMRNDILGYKNIDDEGNEIQKSIEEVVLNNKYIHFSDFPLGKPWAYSSFDQLKCRVDPASSKDVAADQKNCDVWNSIYESYFTQRMVCSKDDSPKASEIQAA